MAILVASEARLGRESFFSKSLAGAAAAVVLAACQSLTEPPVNTSRASLRPSGCETRDEIPVDQPVQVAVFPARPQGLEQVSGDTCSGRGRCVFSGQDGSVRCELQGGDLRCRTPMGDNVCPSLTLAPADQPSREILLTTASKSPLKLAVAIEERENVLSQLRYEYSFMLIDGATCRTGTTIPLGRFRPRNAVLSCSGDVLTVMGRNKDTLEWSVRVFNTRSGAQEHFSRVRPRWKDEVRLFVEGFAIASDLWKVEVEPVIGPTSCFVSGPKCAASLPPREPAKPALFVSFTVEEDLVADALSLAQLVEQGLVDHGYPMRENSNLNMIFSEQKLQQVHADPATAVQVGRMVGASHLIVGRLGWLGEATRLLSLKVVSVESSLIGSVSSVALRNCQGVDLQAALSDLLDTCVPERQPAARASSASESNLSIGSSSLRRPGFAAFRER